MRAADYVRRLLIEAVPRIVTSPSANWDSAPVISRIDSDLRLFWDSRVPGSGAPECLMAAALQSLENKGIRLPPYESLLQAGLSAVSANDMNALHRLSARLRGLMRAGEVDMDHPSAKTWRFAGWGAFDTTIDWPADKPQALDEAEFAQAIAAGWRAQLVGAAVGTALEGYTAQAIDAAFGPICDYVRPPDTFNDDITYELAFLEAVRVHGRAVDSGAIAAEWLGLIPSGWSAEAVALENLRRGFAPPQSATIDNPFDEWIGAQMRGAVCGMVAPGCPREAARLAWLDGQISHAGNGILGGVFNAVLVALAFTVDDARTLLRQTISLFDKRTEYGAAVHFALQTASLQESWRAAWAVCDARYAEYNWIHVLPNAAAQVIALWFGDGNFDRTLEIACGIGHDADCNAAQVLTAIGIMSPHGIAERWTAPLGSEVLTTMRHPTRLSQKALVQATIAAAERLRS